RVRCAWRTVVVSLGAAVLASAIALWLVSQPTLRVAPVAVASLFMGAGISSMHYIGMAAMRLPAMCHYKPSIVLASIVIAVVVSIVALVVCFRLRSVPRQLGGVKFASAVVMGFAIASMHYTGMAAVTFFPSPMLGNVSHAVSVTSLDGVAISVITVGIFAFGAITSLLDRMLSA